MFTIEERIEIVAARLRGQSYEEVRDRFQRKPSRETCILICYNFSYSHSYRKMVSLIQWCCNKMEHHHTLLWLYTGISMTGFPNVDWKGISSYLDTSFAGRRTPGLFAWGFIKQQVYRTKFPNLQVLKERIRQANEMITEDVLVHVFRATVRRWETCFETD
ncbi:hypothetical protein L9F63_020482 [Diploptera punctata]|uniref:Uncharacterized protein n=1 Tax=Diploptera punctata TaxID=6984 RepID=A0AAD8EDI0_DIPPU|nr:hypothetical protein L9F63_020482 [Diploptera punctata]